MRIFQTTRSSSIRCLKRAPTPSPQLCLTAPTNLLFIRRSSTIRSDGRSEKPLRLAVIGSGPAGFYAAYRVMNKIPDAVVDMYERLPVPFGLVRFGVAPDHPEIKNCQDKFEEVARSPRFNFIGNISVGNELPLTALKPHYDAFLFAYGASEDKTLGIPGEDLEGVYSARAFVGWYNGQPEHADLKPKLERGEDAVVIGQGNVALDVARILLSPVDSLRRTDITDYALESLSRSRVRNVRVVGRRGPMQASFTIKEVRELMRLPSVSFTPIEQPLLPPNIPKLPRPQRRIMEVLQKGTDTPPSTALKNWSLEFFSSPKSFAPDSSSHRISAATFEKTQYTADSDPLSKSAKVTPTGDTISYPASLAFRSVGYKSSALPGLHDIGVPFDQSKGIIPNDRHGRVLDPALGPGDLAAGHVPGMYCAGWVKRGPTGVIASTMDDAFTSADVIAADWLGGVPFLNREDGGGTGLGWDGVRVDAERRGLRRVDWKERLRIDEAERTRGAAACKEREKFSNVDDMLRVLDS